MLIGYLRWYKFDLLKAHQKAAFFQAMKCDDNLTIIGHLLLSAWGAHSIYIGLYHDDTSWKWIDNSTVQENSDIWSFDEPDNSNKGRSEEHTSELQSRETISYAVFCLKKKKKKIK